MSEMSANVYEPRQVRELDRIAIEEQGTPGYELMTRAGQACFAAIRERYPAARRWQVLCGSGNNAGDGYVIARLARQSGIDVQLLAVSAPEDLGGDAATAWEDYRAAGGAAQEWTVAAAAEPADLIIDALLGTGLERPLEGQYLAAVQAANQAAVPAVGVDIASGLHGKTGAIMVAAIQAELTVTFVGLKQGLFLAEGPAHSGEIVFADLGIEPVPDDRVAPTLKMFGYRELAELLPPRPRVAHKGNHGHVLVIGGNTGMGGAVRLAGEAALRAGAGLVSVATRAEHVPALLAGRPELMARGIATDADLEPLLERADVLAVGPGLGTDDWAQLLFSRALATGKPLVLDADALNLLAAQPVSRDDWILTPHPGEAARLLRTETRAVQADRLGAVRALVNKYGGTALLKGHGTLVAGTTAPVPWLIRAGNPGMGTAGMGDVLTGVAAALTGQLPGVAADQVAAAAAWVHATAGDRAAGLQERGLLATDLMQEIRACLNP